MALNTLQLQVTDHREDLRMRLVASPQCVEMTRVAAGFTWGCAANVAVDFIGRNRTYSKGLSPGARYK